MRTPAPAEHTHLHQLWPRGRIPLFKVNTLAKRERVPCVDKVAQRTEGRAGVFNRHVNDLGERWKNELKK